MRSWRSREAAARAERLLHPGAISVHHQPVVCLKSGRTYAYEALMRPRLQEVGDPLAAFRLAEGAGVASALDRACIQAAIDGLPELPDGARLFVNVSPTTLLDGTLSPEGLAAELRALGAPPATVVIELTEHAEVDDLSALAEATVQLRRAGLGLALDDAGAGNSSLQRIGRLRPDFVKLDRSLVHGCDNDRPLLELVGVLISFCETIGSVVVAEGIETLQELAAVKRAGAHLAQGFGIAPPAEGHPGVRPAAARAIGEAETVPAQGAESSARALARPLATVGPAATAGEALARFRADTGMRLLAVLCADRQLMGTISRTDIERLEDAPGARLAAELADRAALVVSEWSDPASLAQLATARENAARHDDIVLAANDGSVAGSVSIVDLLAFLAGDRRRGRAVTSS